MILFLLKILYFMSPAYFANMAPVIFRKFNFLAIPIDFGKKINNKPLLGKTKTIVVATHILGDIDQICDHLGVMHEGRMIFTGSMQDMKRRLRHDDFTLELEGEDEDIEQLAQEAAKLDGIDPRIGPGETLIVAVAEDLSRSAALAEVLKLVDAAKVSLQAIHSGQNATENAYLQLLQEDESHGFGR